MSTQANTGALSLSLGDWVKKFIWNRFLYMVLLTVLCIGIFPFVVLYCLTKMLAEWGDKISPSSKFTAKNERVWDIIGAPYDTLVKLVG